MRAVTILSYLRRAWWATPAWVVSCVLALLLINDAIPERLGWVLLVLALTAAMTATVAAVVIVLIPPAMAAYRLGRIVGAPEPPRGDRALHAVR